MTSELSAALFNLVIRAIFAFGIFICASPILAAEIKTECPAVHPEKRSVLLDEGECLPDGEIRWVHSTDKRIDHGDNVFTDINIHKTPGSPPLFTAKLECAYKDKSFIRLPIPGELLHCGVKYRMPRFLKDQDGKEKVEGEWKALSVWAISETDANPAPTK